MVKLQETNKGQFLVYIPEDIITLQKYKKGDKFNPQPEGKDLRLVKVGK